MIKKDIVLQNENGLHMRPGRLFVQEAKKQACDVSIACNDKKADAKSLIQLLKMGLGKGSAITLSCSGENEQESLDHLVEFIDTLKE